VKNKKAKNIKRNKKQKSKKQNVHTKFLFEIEFF
tara:strand:+ start:132 stop:233 length:102 start_codon:yes stop_codon:yes gene_type:complete